MSAGTVYVPAAWAGEAGEPAVGYDSLRALLESGTVAPPSALCVDEPVDDRLLALVPSGCLLSFPGTGVWDLVDVDRAAARGVRVSNIANYGTDAIAEHTFALILAVTRSLLQADRRVRAGLPPPDCWGTTLASRVLGVVGLGAVGRRTAQLGAAFGMHVLATASREDSVRWAAGADGVRLTSLPDLLERSDVVSLHLRYARGDRPTLGRVELASMKSTAILVNTGRGGLVELTALTEALASGALAGAGLDVLDPEPLPADHPLLALDNVVLSPHVAAGAPQVRRRAIAAALENARSFVRSGSTVDIVR
ncbi:NAD(P)-dependent oxidoreductase [Polymorphospora sp. NPDC051019]|uniref:2-hydroxyacid dehydrogenase n=1 Tax=Polymorphospora sp. NPDC051019 TaxID=3155725 RepID=UPI0034339ED5